MFVISQGENLKQHAVIRLDQQYIAPGGSRPVTDTAYTPGLKFPTEESEQVINVQ